MESESYIKFNDTKCLKSLCMDAQTAIKKTNEWHDEQCIKEKVAWKNSGLFGWVRKLVGKNWDENKAKNFLRKGDHVLGHGPYRCNRYCEEVRVFKLIESGLKNCGEIFLSTDHYSMLIYWANKKE